MSQFWSKKTIAQDGRIENVYDPQGMLENYWFPVREGGKASDVKSVGGGKASPDNLEILNFFVQKLYQSLKVPLSRLNSETAFSDGESITREELCFAEYIINMQKLWAAAIKKSFIVHLKLKGKKLLQTAKKLNIDYVIDKKQPANSFQVSQIYKDNFHNKCWDYYDMVCEEINDKIEENFQELQNKKNLIMEELENCERIISGIETGYIFETVDVQKKVYLENFENLSEQISIIEEQENNLNDVKNDMTSWWEQYDLREEDLQVKFVEPSQFFALREQQIFQLKYDNFNNMSQNDFVSNTLALKKYLGWSDKEILANLDLLRKDAAFRWELAQIEQNGPDFREKALEELQGTMETGALGAEGGGGGLGGMGGPSLPTPSAGGAGGADGGGPDLGSPDTNLPAFGPPAPGTTGDAPQGGGEPAPDQT
jgi:hypothetical protein